ncbi:HprK-related kinase A [Methylicorpusculum sp.]|uniref:HprK-related kinase A n=1 Tax=Methylicorpusculum sp. TaxID=2713644 RepID=UPI0027255069|nr:HprK-related kinase A [Methylicorpusculum sp.]MDO8843393.1 HprK-related kinase A [Methylicorpusculum sp.]
MGNHLGIKLKIGGFHICLTSSIDNVTQHLINLYGDFELLHDDDFIDFHVELNAPSLARRLFRPQVSFSFDGHVPFKPLPYDQAAAMFEWGLNWCIANHSNQYLIIHAAVVERNGQAFIFPGTPGSGKSTLCAALVLSGWRLLSDEMTLISTVDGMVHPVPRPISLKNQSIDVIHHFSDQAFIGQVVKDTAKGTVGHLRPPNASIEQSAMPAKPTKLIFPKYKEASETQLLELSKGKSMMRAAEDCFNYNVLGSQGFDVLGNLIDQCDCYTFEYSQLTEAIQLFTQLTD